MFYSIYIWIKAVGGNFAAFEAIRRSVNSILDPVNSLVSGDMDGAGLTELFRQVTRQGANLKIRVFSLP